MSYRGKKKSEYDGGEKCLSFLGQKEKCVYTQENVAIHNELR